MGLEYRPTWRDYRTVKVTEPESREVIEFEVRSATFTERIALDAAEGQRAVPITLEVLRSNVRAWHGVKIRQSDSGQLVDWSFSHDNLIQLLGQFPDFGMDLLRAILGSNEAAERAAGNLTSSEPTPNDGPS